MGDLVFVTNESEVSRLEGVYIRERKPPAVVAGANFYATAICGECVRGPVDKVVQITSPSRFEEVFGGRDRTLNGTGGAIVGKVWQSLLNKKFGRLYVVRAAAAAAAKATKTFADATPTNIIRVDAANPGLWGNDVTIDIAAATDGNANHFNLTVNYLGRKITYKNLDCSGTNDNTLQTIGSDDANLVTITKLAAGRPSNVSASALTSGTEGSIANSDFTATGRGINLLTNLKDVGARFVAGRSNSTMKAAILTLAASTYNGFWLVCPDDETVLHGAFETEVASYRHERIIPCYNHPYTLDLQTASEVVTEPTAWMASILSQVDIDVHPGDPDNRPLLAGITRLSFESLVREDYIALREAGASALEKDDGFLFVSARVSDLTPGKEEVTWRRQSDYLNIGAGRFLKGFAKKPKTDTITKLAIGELISFLGGLKDAERVVKDFAVREVDAPVGVFKIYWQVKLIDFALSVELEAEVGTAVKIQQVN
jgi:hypothetical protein